MSLHASHHGCPNWTSAGCVCVEPVNYREDVAYKLGYLAGMLESARLCWEKSDDYAKTITASEVYRAIGAARCAEIIESHAKEGAK